MREAEARHETVEAELRAKLDLRVSSQPSAEPVDLERSRRVARENAELVVRNQKLLEEAEQLRAENDELANARNHLVLSQAQRDGEERAALKLASTERESLQRRVQHLQQELDSSHSAHERLHEAVLRGESEQRQLRTQLDDAHHGLSSERAAGAAKLAEVQREVDKLKIEMERRHTESLRRETMLQRARDEAAAAAAKQERESTTALARCREEEGMRVKRLESERIRLNDELVSNQSAAAAAAATLRDRLDSAQGECAALKAELHAATVAKTSALEEADKLRRGQQEAHDRLSSTLQELHEQKLEQTSSRVVAESDAASSVAHERLMVQLQSADKQVAESRAQYEEQRRSLSEKVKHAKRQWAREKAALRQSEASKARQVEALKRGVVKLRGEREALRGELLRLPHKPAAASFEYLPTATARKEAGVPRGRLPLDVEVMLTEERVMQAEARSIKEQLLSVEATAAP